MACVKTPSANVESDMEEGEIVDEADELSDISSEEEFLLRQRLQVLENYNNVLERKEAKRSSIGSGKQHRRVEALCDRPDISGADADNGYSKLTLRITKEQKPVKVQHNQKKIKQNDKASFKIKEHKRNHRNKKKIAIISESETSEGSDDEFRNKRQKLEDAVFLNKAKTDSSTLKDRLTKMLCGSKSESLHVNVNSKISDTIEISRDGLSDISSNVEQTIGSHNNLVAASYIVEPLNISNSIDIKKSQGEISPKLISTTVVDPREELNGEGNSDEDLDMLRQLALKTKTVKYKLDLKERQMLSENKPIVISEEEDSDTTELRMICLKSAFLKKAIEIKQKQKLQKRLSQSAIVPEDCAIQTADDDMQVDNNTDIESVDMEIGSDGEDKGKILSDCILKHEIISNIEETNKIISKDNLFKDELEDDEDLLRAKLLTSLSKNLPNLVGFNNLDSSPAEAETNAGNIPKTQTNIQEEKKFIIELGESDSEGEDEATKNLTKMHLKLSEQQEFQQKLDLFLKSTRMEVEKNKLPDVVQQPVEKPTEKFVAKAMKHLPKSEQIEYNNLVKRMAELEKLKQARQNTVNIKIPLLKETLKPRNVTIESYKIASAKRIEERIALSRKKIATESEKMLKLKEEAKKLSQRYKIVATELKNIATAVTINKKHQRIVQNSLSKIRHQHQMLLKGSPSKHSSQNIQITRQPDKITAPDKLQKENDPFKEEYKNPNILKSVKVSVVNNFNNDTNPVHPRLSVEVDLSNNKKVVKLPKSPGRGRLVDIKRHSPDDLEKERIATSHVTERETKKKVYNDDREKERIVTSHITEKETKRRKSKDESQLFDVAQANVNDYKSPLDSLQCKNWEEDPNGVLCPFEVGGSCRDPDCKFLHPKIPKSE